MILDNNYMVKQILSPQECSQVVEAGVKHLQQAQTFKSSIGENDAHRNSEVAWFTDPTFIQKIAPIISELNNVAGWAYDVDEVENIQFTKYGVNQHYHWHPDSASDWQNIYKPTKKNDKGVWIQGRYAINPEGTGLKHEASPDGFFPMVKWTDDPAPVNVEHDAPTNGWVADKTWWGKVRKLSMTINLSEPGEYEGGNLEMKYHNADGEEEIKVIEEGREQGSIILFPSYRIHRISPVTRGTRYSMVIWCLGKPWR